MMIWIWISGLTFSIIACAYMVALFNLLNEFKEYKLERDYTLLWALCGLVIGSVLLLAAVAYLLAKVAGLL
nr:MAG TPA: protein of unknown function DUF2304 [Caudoviricetes sp.]